METLRLRPRKASVEFTATAMKFRKNCSTMAYSAGTVARCAGKEVGR